MIDFNFKLKDQKECLVCHLNKQEFEKMDLDFNKHTKNEHFIFSYFEFISQLKMKKKTDCYGFERYVVEKLDKLDFSWIPYKRALCLG